MNAVIYQLVCTRFFRPFIVKYIKKLQEKRFHFTKNLAYILPQNGLKVSNYYAYIEKYIYVKMSVYISTVCIYSKYVERERF